MKPISVHIFGGEGIGWALDADVQTTRESLESLTDTISFTSMDKADVIHSVWEYPLLHMDPKLLAGKKIVCHVCNDVMRIYEDPAMVAADETIGLWIAQSRKAYEELNSLGVNTTYIPYTVDTSIFRPINPSNREDILHEYNLPKDKFIISNFMRDSNGGNLSQPKEQKGVEAFLVIAVELKKRNLPIHFLLAGPRRHWLRDKLASKEIPFTYVGHIQDTDDNHINILPPKEINKLYQASDLHLVTSRWEGGPRAVLEAAANQTPILCTPVGLAPEVLETHCLFEAVDQAVEKLQNFINGGIGSYPLKAHFEKILKSHIPKANVKRFKKIYENIETVPTFHTSNTRWLRSKEYYVPVKRTLGQRVKERLTSIRSKDPSPELTIGLWHEFHKPPYGGGNQFMLALKQALESFGIKVSVNQLNRNIDVHICNSAFFDTEKFEKKCKQYPIRMIHRIDGPVSLYRGGGPAVDTEIFNLNKKYASATVFQSAYSFRKSIELGYKPVSPVIVHNAVDNDIFQKKERGILNNNKKIRLISTAWSDNPRKGGPFYKWLDHNLDFDRYEYTFVGRINQKFDRIIHVQPLDSPELSKLLQEHDIYITASLNEPCSNALLEAMACGLPALYRNDGGSGELVQFGGLPFNNEIDFIEKLERIASSYILFRDSIYLKSIKIVAGKYLNIAKKIANEYQ